MYNRRVNHRKGTTVAFLLLLGDAVCVSLSIIAAYGFRFHTGFLPVDKGIPGVRPYLALIPFLIVIIPTIFSIQGLYQTRGRKTRPEELIKIFLSAALAQLILMAIMLFYREFSYSRVYLIVHFVIMLFLLITWRFSFRAVSHSLHRRGRFLERILIVGAGSLGEQVVEKICQHRELGFVVVGFLDDDSGKQTHTFMGVRVLGNTETLIPAVQELNVDSVYIALPLRARKKIFHIVKELEDLYVEVRLIPDVVQLMALQAAVEDLDGIPVVHLNAVPLEGWSSVMKRAMDLSIAVAAIVLLSPAWLCIALLIKREDGGPVYFKQERMGLDGKRFLMWKFRSMKMDAENTSGPVFARKDDPRRTRIGSFLRRTSLDELPQLINVIRGQMSIVGPRPERPEFVEKFRKQFPSYMVRHRVRCGITGWAQVNGYRGQTSIKKRLELDLYYIQNWSIGLDLKIIWRTFKSGLWKNAY